jgi:hypothetical protein
LSCFVGKYLIAGNHIFYYFKERSGAILFIFIDLIFQSTKTVILEKVDFELLFRQTSDSGKSYILLFQRKVRCYFIHFYRFDFPEYENSDFRGTRF